MIGQSSESMRLPLRRSSACRLAPYVGWLIGAGALALFSSFHLFEAEVHAAPINYGSFTGNTVVYSDVREDANSAGDSPPLFGEPITTGPVTPGYPAVPCVLCSIPGDTLAFAPTGFGASATGAGGIDITDGNLTFKITSKPGIGISNLKLAEAGDLTMIGTGTDLTNVGVTAYGILNITEVDGVGINTIAYQFTLNFSPSGGTFGFLSDGGGGPLPYFDDWNGSLLIDVDGILAVAVANGDIPAFSLGATKISVNLDNTLVAQSQAGTSALIAKKDFGVSIDVNIPEPATFVMAAIGLLSVSFGMIRRR